MLNPMACTKVRCSLQKICISIIHYIKKKENKLSVFICLIVRKVCPQRQGVMEQPFQLYPSKSDDEQKDDFILAAFEKALNVLMSNAKKESAVCGFSKNRSG